MSRRLFPFPRSPLLLLVALGLVLGLPGGGLPGTYAEEPKPDASGGAGGGGDGAGVPIDDDEDELPTGLNARIEHAIKRGVDYLKSAQLPDGSWGPIEGNAIYGGGEKTGNEYRHPAGSTALALYTLLKCKQPVDDPVIKKGFGFLRSKHKIPGSSYEISAMLLAVTAVADPFKKASASELQGEKIKFPAGDWREWAQKLRDALLDRRKKAGKGVLGWRYQTPGGGTSHGGEQDLSSTQFAALALLAAERCGIRTDRKVWNDILTYAMAQQQDDGPEWPRAVYDRPPKSLDVSKLSDEEKQRYGPAAGGRKDVKDRARGFSYIKSNDAKLDADERNPSGSMTACGIGAIIMARYILTKHDDATFKGRNQAQIQQALYDGCAWLDANWSPYENPNRQRVNIYHIYYVYCFERAFDLINNRRLGNRDWYIEMAEQLVGRQNKEKGFWDSNTTHKPEKVLDTCFALLFLKRSTKHSIPYGSITGGGDEPPVDNRGR